MFRTIVKLALLVLLVVAIYLLVTDRSVDFDTSDLPAVSYQEVVDTVIEEVDEIASIEDEQIEEEDVEEVLEEEPQVATQEIVPETSESAEFDDTAVFPAQFNLAVPFTSQAPHADWALPYQEACEEASAYMVAEYYKGTPAGKIDPDVADEAILELIDFEDDYLGYHLDTTAEETASIIDAFYGLSVLVMVDPTVESIKEEVAAGRPVIVPAAGQELGNPNFTGAGPLYHMLVIKGYTENTFITNDPGTRNGENYVYDIDVLMSAIGDWNNGDPANGAEKVIFVRP